MDSDKCDALLCILETGSLSAAAEQLGYTPSGMSRMIAGMEKEAGFPLLLRSREGVSPTRECEQLLPLVRELSYWGKRYTEETRSIRGIETGTVMVGSVYGAFYPWLSEMIAGFSALHPGIDIDILEGTSSEMAAAIEARRGDFCIMSRRDGDFRFKTFLKDEALAILPKNHPLAKGKALSMKEFEKEAFIQLYPNKESDTSIILAKNHITPNVRFATEDLFAGYAMVEAGLGICMENGVTARPLGDRIALLPMEPREFIEIGIGLPNPDVISPAAKSFADYALQRLPKMEE